MGDEWLAFSHQSVHISQEAAFMKTTKRALLCLLAALLGCGILNAQSRSNEVAAAVIESGKFRFYETKQIRGEENYQITKSATGELTLTTKIDLPFAEQDNKPQVSASLRASADYTPRSFQIKGPTLLDLEEDSEVLIQGASAQIKDRGHDSTAIPSKNFFTMSGYVPVAIEMMLVRYWLAHGRPQSIALLPVGEAFVELRGKDSVTIAGKSIVLSRYHLSGKNWRGGWGRQTLWLDDQNRLVAAVNLGSDIETNLYAFRDGFESQTSFFLKRAVDDAIDRLTELANQLSPRINEPIALAGGTLIDVTGKPAIPNSVVVIQDGRIVAAGPRAAVKMPANAKVIDITGKFLLPGLWDMHSHFYQTEFGPAYLAAGITTARDVGNDIEYGTSLRDAAKQGRGLGPRMLLAGYIDGKDEGHGFDVEVETPDEARAAVQRYKTAGYEQIKIRDHVKLETLKVICAEAHRLGLTVTGHVPEGMNALQAVEAGMDQLNHINYVETGFFPSRDRNNPPVTINLGALNVVAALKFFKEHGTVIDPTDAVLELMLRPMNQPIESFEPGSVKVAPELKVQINKKGEAAEQAEGLRMVMDVLLKITEALQRAGVPIVAGTDVGVPGHTLQSRTRVVCQSRHDASGSDSSCDHHAGAGDEA
jgi:imidazolonepropionase-like amidohydrolase